MCAYQDSVFRVHGNYDCFGISIYVRTKLILMCFSYQGLSVEKMLFLPLGIGTGRILGCEDVLPT